MVARDHHHWACCLLTLVSEERVERVIGSSPEIRVAAPSHSYAILSYLPVTLESREMLEYTCWGRLGEGGSISVAMGRLSSMSGEDTLV